MLKKIYFLCFFLLTSLLSAQQLSTPLLSHLPGYYSDSIFVTITSSEPGASIHYTLNGNEPTLNSTLYTGPILLKNRSGVMNSFSLIPTNPGFNYPLPGYDSSRADSRGWLPPYGEVYKTNVLKVKVFKNGISSNTVSASYFIDPLLNARYSLPVLSITTDSNNFFSDTTGIYVYGINNSAEGNYSVEGTERQVHLQYFDINGAMLLSQYCGARNRGGGGRHAPQKSLALIARDSYGEGAFNLRLFVDKNTDKFKSFVLRNGGHRPDCFPRDDLASKIVQHLNFEVQHTRQVIVFVNGEYWGIQSIKDIFDEHYLANKYNLQKEDVSILELSGSVDDGLPTDNAHYLSMRNFVTNQNLNVSSNYAYINTQMDVENYIDYMNSEIYFGNGDWPNNNIKYWRYRTSTYDPNAALERDGRWRWMFYDLDAAFGGDCSGIYFNYNALNTATSIAGGNSTLLLRGLLQSDQFKNDFINRMADLLNTTFLSSRIQIIASDLSTEITPLMQEHVERWRYPAVANTLLSRSVEIPSLTKWNTINAGLADFADKRPGKIRNHFMTHFSLTDTVKVTVDVSDTLAGRVKISTLIIDHNTIGIGSDPYPWTGTYFTSVPIPLKAIANPGYKFINWLNTSITNPDTVVYLNSDTSFVAVFEVDTSFHAWHYLYINELQSDNVSTLHDEYGEYNDWLEIYNPNTFSVDIDNFYVTDSISYKTKYRFKSGSSKTIIPPHGFLLVWLDDQKDQGVLHANFKLSSFGEELALVLPDGQTIVDSLHFSAISANYSWGREHDGDSVWVAFKVPTPQQSNRIITVYDDSQPLIVYPNPSMNFSTLFFNKPAQVRVYNSIGQIVYDARSKIVELDVLNLKPGVYFIKSEKDEVVKWIKL